MSKNSKKKNTAGIFIMYALFLIIGMFFGRLIIPYLYGYLQINGGANGKTFICTVLLLSLYVGFFLQIIIHEAGHLVFGLLSGYKFGSFRIANFMWITENGSIKFKRHSLAGTAGQCIMIPPDFENGKIPFILYNLGGTMMNIISAFLFLTLSAIFKNGYILPAVMLNFTLVGLLCAVTNGVPMRTGTIDNDGYNALTLARNSKALRAFWIQMKIAEQSAKGVRPKEMPDEWFAIPADEEMKNGSVAAIGVFACNRFLDEHKFDEARELSDHLLDIDSSMAGVHRCLLTCDRIFLELIGENNSAVLEKLYNKKQKKFMLAMKNSITVLRTEYAYALLAERDVTKADNIKTQFEKRAKTYPYPIDIVSERELMDIAFGRFQS